MRSLSSLFFIQLSSSEGVPSRVNGSVLDGSYLALAATQAGWPPVHRGADGRRGAAKTLSDHVSLSTMTIPSSSPSGSERTPTEGSVKQQSVQKGERSVLYSESYSRSEHYPDSGYRTQPQKTNDPLLANGHHSNQNRYSSIPYSSMICPLLSHSITSISRVELYFSL